MGSDIEFIPFFQVGFVWSLGIGGWGIDLVNIEMSQTCSYVNKTSLMWEMLRSSRSFKKRPLEDVHLPSPYCQKNNEILGFFVFFLSCARTNEHITIFYFSFKLKYIMASLQSTIGIFSKGPALHKE